MVRVLMEESMGDGLIPMSFYQVEREEPTWFPLPGWTSKWLEGPWGCPESARWILSRADTHLAGIVLLPKKM